MLQNLKWPLRKEISQRYIARLLICFHDTNRGPNPFPRELSSFTFTLTEWGVGTVREDKC